MQAKAMRNYHLHHPFDNSPAALPWPTDPPETVRKLADLTRSHAKATMQTPAEPPLRDLGQQATHPFFQPHTPPAPPPPVPPKRARRERGAPAPNQARKAATSRPPAPPPTQLASPDQASSSSSLPSLPPPHPDQASPSSSLPPPALPQPEAYPGFEKGAKVQQLFRNDHTGDWIWCEGTIKYRLRDVRDNGGPQIQVLWHAKRSWTKATAPGTNQKATPWSSTAPSPSGSAPTRTRPTEAPITLRNSPLSGAKAFPHRAYPSAHHQAKSPRAPVPLPDGARAEGTSLHSPGPLPPRPP